MKGNVKEFKFDFPSAPHPRMTDKYVFVDTKEVINLMTNQGYEVAEIKGGRSGYQTHQIDFRRPGAEKGNWTNEEVPRILFQNSYDGTTKAQVLMGVFRMVCSNGMIVGDAFHREKVLHVGDAAETLIDRIKQASKEATKIFDRIEKFKTVELDKAGIREFAQKARALRFNNEEVEKRYDLNLITMPRRKEDVGNSLWKVLNRIQENLIKGGLPGTSARGTSLLMPKIKLVKDDTRVNQGLWDLAEEMI